MDVMNILQGPPQPPPPNCPVPPRPFSNIAALGLTFVIGLIFDFFLRYVYVTTDQGGVRAATMAVGGLIWAICIGVYAIAAVRNQRKTQARPDPSASEFALTIVLQLVLLAATYWAAHSAMKH